MQARLLVDDIRPHHVRDAVGERQLGETGATPATLQRRDVDALQFAREIRRVTRQLQRLPAAILARPQRPGGVRIERDVDAALHLCAAIPNCPFVEVFHDLPGFTSDIFQWYLAEPVRLDASDGCMAVPDKPGFGVELDEDKIRRYATVA